ncbi:MAG: asparaginase domain-containing protein [Planctomycetota bacterium]|nr:asparaginase domain-containing protein [Planctomycetota bacterium]
MTDVKRAPFRLSILTTGGTIEKTYSPHSGALANEASILDILLGELELPEVAVRRIAVCNLDSLDMTDADHQAIVDAVRTEADHADGIIVVHGTDRLAVTGERLHRDGLEAGAFPVPVVLTGAMRPYELRSSDALQNMTEAILAVQLLPPAVYCVLHSKVLRFPGVSKDPGRGTFGRVEPDTH